MDYYHSNYLLGLQYYYCKASAFNTSDPTLNLKAFKKLSGWITALVTQDTAGILNAERRTDAYSGKKSGFGSA